ncbi:MAG: glycerophosphodiester phosphodiesterase [Bacteroidia bacterium]|nr:glycerophosphodiester phosphodiesterase [Bacteroidia bacterium]
MIRIVVWFCFLVPLLGLTQIKPVKHQPEIHGHRGARGLAPENSIPGFLQAIEVGAQWLELDLIVSADNQLIVSHEPWINASICTLNGKRFSASEGKKINLHKLAAEQIRQYDCGSIGNPKFPQQKPEKTYKPTFEELIQAVQATGKSVRWNIEVKSKRSEIGKSQPDYPSFAKLVSDCIRKHNLASVCMVQSFDKNFLQVFHQVEPEIRISYLTVTLKSPQKQIKQLGFTPWAISPYYQTLSEKKVKQAQELGLKVIPWTVNQENEMKRLIEWKVDGIITDYPNKLVEIYRQSGN